MIPLPIVDAQDAAVYEKAFAWNNRNTDPFVSDQNLKDRYFCDNCGLELDSQLWFDGICKTCLETRLERLHKASIELSKYKPSESDYENGRAFAQDEHGRTLP